MIERRPVFPGVIEMNHQAGWRIGCNVYLVYDDRDWALIDIGYEESVDEIVELVRQMDFPLSQCRALIATHADVDHIQGLAKAKGILKAPVLAHPLAVESLETGDRIKTFAEMNSAWDAWVVPGQTPARATVEAKLAAPGLDVEIMVEAAILKPAARRPASAAKRAAKAVAKKPAKKPATKAARKAAKKARKK